MIKSPEAKLQIDKILNKYGLSISDIHDIPCGQLYVYSNGIFHYQPDKENSTLTLQQLKDQHKIYCELRKGIAGPFLSDNRQLKSMGSEEKSFIKDTFQDFASRSAVIVSHGISKFLFNTFMHIKPPSIPLKSFLEYDSAIHWLITSEKAH